MTKTRENNKKKEEKKSMASLQTTLSALNFKDHRQAISSGNHPTDVWCAVSTSLSGFLACLHPAIS